MRRGFFFVCVLGAMFFFGRSAIAAEPIERCHEAVQARRWDDAVQDCRAAANADDTAANHALMTIVLLQTSKAQNIGTLTEADHQFKRAWELAPNEASTLGAGCELAIARKDVDSLERYAKMYVQLHDSPNAEMYLATAQLARGDWDAGEASIDKAKALGLPDDAYRGIKAQIASERPLLPRLLWGFAYALGAWFVAFALLWGIGSFLSKSTLRAASKMPDASTGRATGVSRTLRRAYRFVLSAASLYYYVSLPLLAVLLVVVGVAVVYAFLMLGRIPIKLLAIMGVVLLSSLYALLKALFTRVKEEDPGDALDLRKHPKLEATLAEVAERIGTRPVDTVFVTPGTDFSVFERGRFRAKWQQRSERVLVIGAGVLDGMEVRPFKAILAHEYGHFHNEDTAGGGFALGVRRHILHFAMALAQHGSAAPYNPAWLFVTNFHKVFLRVSQGASRLQEILADRWAAFAYGGEAFEAGLRHVVRRSIHFDAHADFTIAEVVENKRPLANLYRYTPEKTVEATKIDEAFDEAWHAKPSDYDSHPRPSDRIAWVRALDSVGAAPADHDSDLAWSLFSNASEVEEQMTALVRARIAENHGVRIEAA